MGEDTRAFNQKPAELNFVREIVSKEVEYLREKEWKLFSWASSVQFAFLGGVIGLVSMKGAEFPSEHRILLAVSSAILTLYAWLWIRQTLHREEQALEILIQVDKELEIPSTGWSIRNPQFGYLWALSLFETVVLLTIMLVGLSRVPH